MPDPALPSPGGPTSSSRPFKSASATSSRLVAFSQKQVQYPRTFVLRRFVEDKVARLKRLIPEDIQLDIICRTGDAMARSDSPQLEQVVINLVTNACDTMPSGGTLTVEAALPSRSGYPSSPWQNSHIL